jgi:RNA polymerase sigma-70 factor (ECF subfamily)
MLGVSRRKKSCLIRFSGSCDLSSGNVLHIIFEPFLYSVPDDYRLVFILRDVEEMSAEETAECLNISQENVKVRLHRARAGLRKELYARAGATALQSFHFHAARCDRVVKNVFKMLGF